MESPLAPRELALQARDLLIKMADKPGDADLTKKPAFLVPNPVNDIDPTTQQNTQNMMNDNNTDLNGNGISGLDLHPRSKNSNQIKLSVLA